MGGEKAGGGGVVERGRMGAVWMDGNGVSRVVEHFCFNDTATTEIYTLSLHDALPISAASPTYRYMSPFRSPTCRYMSLVLPPAGTYLSLSHLLVYVSRSPTCRYISLVLPPVGTCLLFSHLPVGVAVTISHLLIGFIHQ